MKNPYIHILKALREMRATLLAFDPLNILMLVCGLFGGFLTAALFLSFDFSGFAKAYGTLVGGTVTAGGVMVAAWLTILQMRHTEQLEEARRATARQTELSRVERERDTITVQIEVVAQTTAHEFHFRTETLRFGVYLWACNAGINVRINEEDSLPHNPGFRLLGTPDAPEIEILDESKALQVAKTLGFRGAGFREVDDDLFDLTSIRPIAPYSPILYGHVAKMLDTLSNFQVRSAPGDEIDEELRTSYFYLDIVLFWFSSIEETMAQNWPDQSFFATPAHCKLSWSEVRKRVRNNWDQNQGELLSQFVDESDLLD